MKAEQRCDRCNAQAYVMTVHGGTGMYWCAHHFKEFEYYLGPHVVQDDREALEAKN